LTRVGLTPLAAVYRAGVAAKNLAYDHHWLRAKRLRWPVVSIGNLSVGGSGKTPLAIRLAELLAADGMAVDVLSRGYGRSSRSTELVDPAGDAEQFGDEPLLIARRTAVPVYVGASRYEAGLLAETRPISEDLDIGNLGAHLPAVHLLDDGFQHRQLARDVDIVVVHRTDFIEKLLPAGRLRESLAALRRADFLALREEDAELEPRLRQLGITAPVWWMRRSVQLPTELGGSKRVVAFCGIARPEEFFAALAAAGCSPLRTVSFVDHHRYSRADAENLARVAAELSADALITTEKDAVKLDAALLPRIQRAALLRVVPLMVSLRDEPFLIRQLLNKLQPPSRSTRS
jgi:tetraacyldisaccharide 4'-kinase